MKDLSLDKFLKAVEQLLATLVAVTKTQTLIMGIRHINCLILAIDV